MEILHTPKPLLLLADDQAANLHALAAQLKAHYELQFATDGKTALALANAETPPDLILLDVIMPGVSGIQVLQQLRSSSNTSDIPVILVSADNSEQNELNGLDSGADDYLTKPVQANILQARVRNLLQKKRAEAQSRLASHVFQHSGEAMFIADKQHLLVDINLAFQRLTGYTLADVHLREPQLLALNSEYQECIQAIWPNLKSHDLWRGEIWLRHRNGAAFPTLFSVSVMRNRRQEAEYFIASLVDISAQKASEDEIRRLAHHDSLTGLPNRLYLMIHLEQALVLARRSNQGVALMFIDLDRFKMINDTLGHEVGDSLLIEVANRLRASVRESDLVARLGGDEFVVVLHNADSRETVQPVAEKILHRLGQEYVLAGNVLHNSPSIGISLYPHDAMAMDELIKNADSAMYQAKAQGRNNAQYFSLHIESH